MSEKVLCPYCPEGVEMQETWSSASIADESMPYGIRHASYLHFYCPACQTFSPRAETIEDATHLALRRYQPENRVLTLEDISNTIFLIPCFVEDRYGPTTQIIADILDRDGVSFILKYQLEAFNDGYRRYADDYRKTWRCWERYPTEEERKAVPWE